MIELIGITKKYAGFTAVKNLDLTVEKGEVFGFLGPNGAGKTTTIKIMGGILAPTSGTVTIRGVDMLKEPEKAKKKIGFIPDRPYLYEKLTGMEFLRFTADLFHMKRNGFYRKAEEKLELFSLSDRADELIESYSHGMKQRLIMAAALIHEPEVIIVDEPTVGLDPAGVKKLEQLFRDQAASGVSIFMSTHSLSVAGDICDRVGIIHQGSLIALGTPDELKQRLKEKEADLEQIFLALTQEAQNGKVPDD